MRLPGGRIAALRDSARPQFDRAGRVSVIAGFTQDVTDLTAPAFARPGGDALEAGLDAIA